MMGFPLHWAGIVYGVLLLLGVAGMGWVGTDIVPDELELVGEHVLLGFLLGAAVAWSSHIAERYSARMRDLNGGFADVLGALDNRSIVVLALLSGIAEEIFFRGFLLSWLGLLPSSIVFGACHFPIDTRFRLWPVLAFVAGLGFGWLYLATGSLVAPSMAHVTVNGIGLYLLSRREV